MGETMDEAWKMNEASRGLMFYGHSSSAHAVRSAILGDFQMNHVSSTTDGAVFHKLLVGNLEKGRSKL